MKKTHRARLLRSVVLILFFAPLSSTQAASYSCPPATPEGDQEISAQVVRYLLSGFGTGIPSQGLPCLTPKTFPQFRIPQAGTESGDSTEASSQVISPVDQTRVVRIQSAGKNQLRVQFEFTPSQGKKTALEEVVFLRHHHPRAQEQLGCVSFLERPKTRYRPSPGYCPGVPPLVVPPSGPGK